MLPLRLAGEYKLNLLFKTTRWSETANGSLVLSEIGTTAKRPTHAARDQKGFVPALLRSAPGELLPFLTKTYHGREPKTYHGSRVPLGYSHALKPGKYENSDPIVTIEGMDVPAEFCTRVTLVDASPSSHAD